MSENKKNIGIDITDVGYKLVPCLIENKAMVTSMLGEEIPNHPSIRLNIPEKEKKMSNAPCLRRLLMKRLQFTLILNIFITIAVIVLVFTIESGMIPYQRKTGFVCKDPTISFIYKGDTITIATLFTGCIFGSLLLIVLSEVAREKSFRKVCPGVVWIFWKEALLGLWFVVLLTEAGKIIFGEHRPHFMDTCRPDVMHDCVEGTFVEEYTCTNTEHVSYLILDSSRSFPSGHSSMSMFIALFGAYIVQTRIPTATVGRVLKTLMIILCFVWGTLCSVSRIADRRHHWWDVLFGSLIGLSSAAYFLIMFHQKQASKLNRSTPTSVSSTMLLDIKNKDAASARV